ncbi:tyrosine recombinase XerC [Streptomyces sp. NPDC056910]|uniref:site-specific integrase n=1 Tax=Streptomyces sp. NPDC056910 TaxID=3345964 RepID=UPI0036B4E542
MTVIQDPREVTTEHIKEALKPLIGSAARRLQSALRSYFRALKRERLVFRDPARTVRPATARSLPESLPGERIVGLLDRLRDARSRFMVGLVAIHALSPRQLVQLQQTDLDWSRAQMRIRRLGRMEHLIYLDGFTLELATAWEVERRRRWPDCSNPHLFVTRNTAVDDSGPPTSDCVVTKVFRRVGATAGALRVDRIVDEARHSADPVRLMRLFGLSNLSATRYVLTAHPDKRVDPIALSPGRWSTDLVHACSMVPAAP